MGDTGESSATIKRRMDDMTWPKVLGLLKSGAILFRPSGMRDYYTWPARPGAAYVEATCLTATGVKNRAAEGVLLNIGVDRYGVNPDWVEATKDGAGDDQPDLFGAAA